MSLRSRLLSSTTVESPFWIMCLEAMSALRDPERARRAYERYLAGH